MHLFVFFMHLFDKCMHLFACDDKAGIIPPVSLDPSKSY